MTNNDRSTTQKVVGKVTRIGASIVSVVVGEINACTTGKTDEADVKKERAIFVDKAENSMVKVADQAEKVVGGITKIIKKRKG